jgi:hypothetical protein
MSFLSHCELKQKTWQCQEACLARSKLCHVWRRVTIAPSQHRNSYWPLPECGIELQDLHLCIHIHKFSSCNLGDGFYNTFYISPVTLKSKLGCITATLEVFSTSSPKTRFPWLLHEAENLERSKLALATSGLGYQTKQARSLYWAPGFLYYCSSTYLYSRPSSTQAISTKEDVRMC